jgi:hypothetical protein
MEEALLMGDSPSSGGHPKRMQGLARHSTITLTLDRYLHLELVGLETATKALPAPAPPEPEEKVLVSCSLELTRGSARPEHR